MRVILGRRGDYAVRAMIDVARHWEQGRRKTRQIAAAMDIPTKFLTLILAELAGAGFLNGRQGPAGGYTLTRPPEDISLREVVEAAEGPVALDTCVLSGGPCDWVEACPIHDTWSEAQAAFKTRLDATTLADLAATDLKIEAGRHSPAQPTHATDTERRGTRN